MSAAIDTLEHMFDYEQVSPASSSTAPVLLERTLSAPAATQSGSRATVAELKARITSMQTGKLASRLIPTDPVIAGLLPGGGLQQGAAYSLDRSAMLLMTLLAAPSVAGAWCGIVGLPEFGVEAAQHAGVDLGRLVLVPHPGEQWLTVTAAMTDVMGIVVVRPPQQATDSSVARLAARLRQRGTTLLVLGPWPQAEAMLSLSSSQWHGIGEGHGHLAAREVTVTVTGRASSRARSARLRLPGGDPVRYSEGRLDERRFA